MSNLDDRAAELGPKLGAPIGPERPLVATMRPYYNGVLVEIEGAGVYLWSEATVAYLFDPPPAIAPVPGPNGDPWEYWDAATIAEAANCPQEAVETTWPLTHHALVERGQASKNCQAAAVGTCAIESAHTFMPVTEAFWMSEEWRYANLRYAPFWGRGTLQLTWRENYARMSPVCSINLVDNPDAALEPVNAAIIFAQYFLEHDLQASADAEDWAACRRKVQGGTAGLDEFERIVGELLGV